ncbi:heterogeneous nuclear ribonucleoprotein 1-like [Zingiber officinale]|uniref:heterogeneous nuclear ribonucleoprotein 1-like n=1 Tax=Zingiber officinale TaxID=94328 RepID=UPI001C4CFFCB|nr:heterogeneous nuclear ribonucleoprotein 1-like [Zingiber officinale]
MDSDDGKLFIGGLSWDTTEERLREHFSDHGEVLDAVIMRDKATGRPRGFGFVVFADPSILERVLQDKHVIDGRTVEAKRALSREEQQTSARSGNLNSGNLNAGRSAGASSGANIRTKKIFVGGLPPTLTEDGFRQYFESFGTVTDAVVMYDQNTHRPRGFGFISFESEDTVDNVLQKTFHDLNGKAVEVKRALPKDANSNTGSGRSMGSGSHQSYGGSSGNASLYDSRTDSNRYIQPQGAGGGLPPYGSSGYGAPSYGYGAANNGVGYAGYGVGGYGTGATGYTGPAGTYGNPNAPMSGYVGGSPGAQRNLWNNQVPGYGSAGYGGTASYGPAPSWNASTPSGGSGTTPTGQSGTSGYMGQGYGYGGYGGPEGPYGNQGGYGSYGTRGNGGPITNFAGNAGEQGGSAYSGGGYTNASSGYLNSWKSEPSQAGSYGSPQVNGPPGGQASYGGGYGGPQGRQVQ